MITQFVLCKETQPSQGILFQINVVAISIKQFHGEKRGLFLCILYSKWFTINFEGEISNCFTISHGVHIQC